MKNAKNYHANLRDSIENLVVSNSEQLRPGANVIARSAEARLVDERFDRIFESTLVLVRGLLSPFTFAISKNALKVRARD
jgi:hypothetical protein